MSRVQIPPTRIFVRKTHRVCTGFEAEQLCCEAGPKGNPAYPNLIQRTHCVRRDLKLSSYAAKQARRPARSWEIPPTRILYRCSHASRTASDGFWQRAEGEFQAFEVEQLCCETGPETCKVLGNPARWKLTSSLRKPESCTGVAIRHALRPTSSG